MPGHPFLDTRNEPVQHWIEDNRDDRRGHERVGGFDRQDTEVRADARQDERELANLRERDGDGQRDPKGIAEHAHDHERDERLADHDHRQRRQNQSGRFEKITGRQQHADGDEKEHGKGVAHRQGFRRRAQAVIGSADDEPGQERTERHRDAEECGRSHGDAEREREDRQREELPRAGVGDVVEHEGNDPRADHDREADERGDLQRGHRQRHHDARLRSGIGKEDGQQHERQHREQILDDEPADGDVSGRRMKLAMIGKHADKHDRARDRQRHAEDDARGPAPSEPARDDGAEQGGHGALRDRARNGDAPHRQQLFDMKLQADAEHEEDDADFGQLLGDVAVGHKAGRVRTHERAGQQVADDGREAGALGEIAEERARR